MKFCIANIYGPNADDSSFFHSFFTSLSDHMDNTIIIGDFNLPLDSGMDRLSTTGSLRNLQFTNMNDFGVCDALRFHNPTLREYTFFSPVHHSYSRLDYFLVSSSLISDIPETEIHPITISDHAPVSTTLGYERTTPPSRNWMFNTSLLKDPDFLN